MFLINKLFLLFFLFTSRISTIVEKAPLSDPIKENLPSYSNYDGRELIILTVNKIRNNIIENQNSLKDKEIINMLEILKQKIEVVNIEMNKIEIVFNDNKKTKFDIELLSSQEKDFILKLLNYKGIQLSIKNDFDVIKTWIIKTIGTIIGIGFITNIIKEIITAGIMSKSLNDTLNSIENLRNQNQNKNINNKKIDLIRKYILNENDSEEIALSIKEEYEKQLKEKKESTSKNIEEKKKLNLDNIEDILEKDEDFSKDIFEAKIKKEKIKAIKKKAILNYLNNLPKEELDEKILDFNKKYLSLDNYIQHLPKIKIEEFQIVKNNITFIEPNKKIQFYIFSGEGGSGKTEAARAITNSFFFSDLHQTFIQENYEKQRSFKETVLYAYTGSDFAATKYVGTGSEAFRKFTTSVINDFQEGKKVQVIIDEADILLRDRENSDYKDKEAQTDFLQFLDQIEKSNGLYYKYKDQLTLIMTTNINPNKMDKPLVRRAQAAISFTPIPTVENLHKLFQDILYEKKNNDANSLEETYIYENIRKFISLNESVFKNLYEFINLQHKETYRQAKIKFLQEKNNKQYNFGLVKEIEKITKIDVNTINFEDKEVIGFMENKVSECGAMRISKIIKGLDHFLTHEIIEKLLGTSLQYLMTNKENINSETINDIYKIKERKKNPILEKKNDKQLYEWISNFFKNEDNIKKLQDVISNYLYIYE